MYRVEEGSLFASSTHPHTPLASKLPKRPTCLPALSTTHPPSQPSRPTPSSLSYFRFHPPRLHNHPTNNDPLSSQRGKELCILCPSLEPLHFVTTCRTYSSSSILFILNCFVFEYASCMDAWHDESSGFCSRPPNLPFSSLCYILSTVFSINSLIFPLRGF